MILHHDNEIKVQLYKFRFKREVWRYHLHPRKKSTQPFQQLANTPTNIVQVACLHTEHLLGSKGELDHYMMLITFHLDLPKHCVTKLIDYWLVVEPTHLKNISQNENLSQIGLKIKHIWYHHLDYNIHRYRVYATPTLFMIHLRKPSIFTCCDVPHAAHLAMDSPAMAR